MIRSALRILLVGLAVLLVSAGCGKNWDEIRPLEMEEPSAELERLPVARVIAATENRLNTYNVYAGDLLVGHIFLTTIPWEVSGDTQGRTWRTYDGSGSFAEFHLIPQTGYAITHIHNPRNEGGIVFAEPLVVAPPVMDLGQPHTHQAAFEGWARGWSRRRGTMTITTRYLGLQDVTVPLGHFTHCARVDAFIRIRLPLGFSLAMNHRQWLHPQYGDIIRAVDGRLSWGRIGVKRFHRRMELTATEPLGEEKRLEMVGERMTGE